MKKNKILGVLMIVFGVILLMHSMIMIFASRIEAIMTFPGMKINLQEIFVGLPEVDLIYEEINIDDGFGNNINGIFVEGTSDKIIYYFHGNGGPIDLFFDDIKYINQLGYKVMAYDYPGFGKSKGYPYKHNVDNASQVFYNYIKEQKGFIEDNVIVWGYSIGAAVGTDFASKNNIDKIILISPFSSKYDIIKHYFGFVIQKMFFVPNSYVTKDLVKEFKIPVLLIHGNDDIIIPFSHGKEVYKNYAGEKHFIELDGQGHDRIIKIYGDSLKNIFKIFITGDDLDFEDNYLFIDNEKKESLEFENRIDLFSDDSIQKFVTSTISFNNIAYFPIDLERISGEYIYDAKGGSQGLRKDAKEALDKIGKEFYEEFGKKLSIVSAYRSYEYQVRIKTGGCPDNFCAKAGYSEHQTGLVVDIFEASSEGSWKNNPTLFKYYIWFTKNAHLYGWHNTYQKGLKIDGYEVEPWHWRYLGVELATYLYENNLTIAEYYYIRNNISYK